jgi:hypothetical protein
MGLEYYLVLALEIGVSTVYGFGERYCCDPGKACPCTTGAVTASGQIFDTEKATAAIPYPAKLRIKPQAVFLRVGDGPCVEIIINDKLNARFIGRRGFDLSPRAQELLIGKRDPRWVGVVKPC